VKVSIIIPVYNGGEKFRACLESVRALNPPADEVIVIADSDTDGSRELARGYGARVLVQSPQAGPAKARNWGAREASGDVVFFLDADCTAQTDLIARVKDAMRDSNTAALIGSYDDAPGNPSFLSQYKNLMHHYTHQMGSEEASTFWGACGAVRRDVFLSLNGFDAEKYTRPCIEDIELGYRMRAAGHKIRLVKDLQIKHLKQWTASSLFKTDFYDRALPWTELLLSSGTMLNDLNLKQGDRVSVALSWVLTGALGLGITGGLAALLGAAFGTTLVLIGLVLAVLSAGGLIVLNRAVYAWLREKRGTIFMLRAIPWHWFYFVYSGAAYALGIIRYKFLRRARA